MHELFWKRGPSSARLELLVGELGVSASGPEVAWRSGPEVTSRRHVSGCVRVRVGTEAAPYI